MRRRGGLPSAATAAAQAAAPRARALPSWCSPAPSRRPAPGSCPLRRHAVAQGAASAPTLGPRRAVQRRGVQRGGRGAGAGGDGTGGGAAPHARLAAPPRAAGSCGPCTLGRHLPRVLRLGCKGQRRSYPEWQRAAPPGRAEAHATALGVPHRALRGPPRHDQRAVAALAEHHQVARLQPVLAV